MKLPSLKRRHFVQALPAVTVAPRLLAQQAPYAGSGGDKIVALETGVPDAASEPVPHFFSSPQLSGLRKLSDIILPRIGETPGALDARAAEFLDFLIGNSPADRQTLYRNGLDALNAQARTKFGKTFADLAVDQSDQLLAPLRKPWTYKAPAEPLAAFLHTAKADILQATVSSKEWISVVSQRNRNAAGTGIYWHSID